MQLWHVTTASAATSILRGGFEPRIGPRSGELGEERPATYFFNSFDDLDAAMYNWLSEAFEDIEEPLIVFVVAVPSELVHIDPVAGFEAVVGVPVPASAIVRTYDIDTGDDFP